MERIWGIVKNRNLTKEKKIGLFLGLHTILWSFIGYGLWGMLQPFVLKGIIGALCLTGYSGFFIGFVGGIFFLWKKY